MNNSVFLTSFITVLTGTTIYCLGQIIQKLWIEPISKQRETIGDIVDALIYYANIYSNVGLSNSEKTTEANERFRQIASQLRVKSFAIPNYTLLSSLRIIIKMKDILEASSGLTGISNSVHASGDINRDYRLLEDNLKRRDSICTALGLGQLE